MSAVVVACLLGTLSVAPAAAEQRPQPPDNLQEGAWWFREMRIAEAHEVTTGKGATVALIDTGIDTSVPELQGADLRLRFDCHGRRARPRSGPPASHGTSQAVLLLGNGRGNAAGGAGVRGIAPDATVLAYDDDLRPETPRLECSTQALSRMFDDAISQGADVISVAATMNDDVIPLVQRALDAGVVVVAASGADDVGGSTFPSDQAGVVSVVAVDERARPWKHSRWGGVPTISAPGVYVGNGGLFASGWSSTGWTSGTSPATTITSGALALVKAKYPDATGNQLLQHLVHYTGGDGPFTWREDYGFGIVSVTNMLETSPTQWPDESPLGKVVPDAVEKYPMSVSTLVDDDTTTGGSEAGQQSEAADPEQAAGPEARSAGGATGSAADSGVPAWTWLAAAVVAVGAGARALRTRRGRRTTLAAGNETRGA